jgi:replicative DNA helicase
MKDIKTEQVTIACMLIDENCRHEYGSLSEHDFTDEANRRIFTAIKTLTKQSKEVDYLTVYTLLNGTVPMTYIAELTGTLPNVRSFQQYVDRLKDLTLKRELNDLADEIKSTDLSGQELAEKTEEKIYKLRDETSLSEFYKIDRIVFDVYSYLDDVYAGKIEQGLSTGYPAIDEIVGGLRKKEYILLGARPSIGKTALGINIAQNVIMRNKTVAFFSYEMSKELLVERLLKGMAKISDKKLKKAKRSNNERYEMTESDWDKLSNTVNYIYNKNLFIDDDPNRTVGDMNSMCRKLKRKHGLDLVIVDYLQKVKPSANGSRREQIEQVSNDLKNMAKQLDVPVLVISSLSRANMQRENKIPILSDLRETGQLEFDADVIMFLHREYYYKPEEKHLKHDADIIIAKNRNGRLGRAKLMWFEEYTRFMSVPEGRETINE